MREHSVTTGRYFYVVSVGYILGIYTDEHIARQQTTRFSNAKWKKTSMYDGAVGLWDEMCDKYHKHDAPVSPSPSPPPPSPSPPPPPSSRTPVRTGPRAASRVALTSPRTPRSPVPQAMPPPFAESSASASHSTPARRATRRYRSDENILWGIRGHTEVFEDQYVHRISLTFVEC
jgi:hypothetical protein